MDAAELSGTFPDNDAWATVLSDVNAWRGACLHHFSVVEMAVTEILLAFSCSPDGGSLVRLRQLVGQRFDDLANATAPDGPFADGTVSTALASYRADHEAFRALLCHGSIKVTVDRQRNWSLIIRSVAIRARQAERSLTVIEQDDARAKEASLKRDGQKLAGLLGQLRKKAHV